jgi:hypothetical protein
MRAEGDGEENLDVIDVTEILVHWHAGRSKSEIAGGLGVDRKTIRKCIAPAGRAALVSGGPPVGALSTVTPPSGSAGTYTSNAFGQMVTAPGGQHRPHRALRMVQRFLWRSHHVRESCCGR